MKKTFGVQGDCKGWGLVGSGSDCSWKQVPRGRGARLGTAAEEVSNTDLVDLGFLGVTDRETLTLRRRPVGQLWSGGLATQASRCFLPPTGVVVAVASQFIQR